MTMQPSQAHYRWSHCRRLVSLIPLLLLIAPSIVVAQRGSRGIRHGHGANQEEKRRQLVDPTYRYFTNWDRTNIYFPDNVSTRQEKNAADGTKAPVDVTGDAGAAKDAGATKDPAATDAPKDPVAGGDTPAPKDPAAGAGGDTPAPKDPVAGGDGETPAPKDGADGTTAAPGGPGDAPPPGTETPAQTQPPADGGSTSTSAPNDSTDGNTSDGSTADNGYGSSNNDGGDEEEYYCDEVKQSKSGKGAKKGGDSGSNGGASSKQSKKAYRVKYDDNLEMDDPEAQQAYYTKSDNYSHYRGRRGLQYGSEVRRLVWNLSFSCWWHIFLTHSCDLVPTGRPRHGRQRRQGHQKGW